MAVVLGVDYLSIKLVDAYTGQQCHKNDAQKAPTQRIKESLASERQLHRNGKQVRPLDQLDYLLKEP